jgi:hypothetical protein
MDPVDPKMEIIFIADIKTYKSISAQTPITTPLSVGKERLRT